MTDAEYRDDIKTQVSDSALDSRVDAYWAHYQTIYQTDSNLVYLYTLLRVLKLRRGKLQKLMDTRRGESETKARQVFQNVSEMIKDVEGDILRFDPAATAVSVATMSNTDPVSIHDGAETPYTGYYEVK